MANCEPNRDRLLDLVYDLLDEAEAQALRGHVDGCPPCREALAVVEGQRRTLARAALPIGVDAVAAFARPSSAALADAGPGQVEEPPATLPFALSSAAAGETPRRRPRRRRYYWLSGAAAAAVVLLAAGLGWHEYQQGHRERTESIAQQKDVIREIDLQLAALEPAYQRNAAAAERKLRNEEPPHLYVLGPARLQPDGGALFQVAVHDLDGKPVDGAIKLTVKDQSGKQVLAEHRAVAKNGTASVPIGDGLAQLLNGQAAVQLIAQAEAKDGGAWAEVQQPLEVARPAYVAHLVLNKTIYRPGELLFYRVLVLDRATLTPPTQGLPLRVALVDAKGTTVALLNAATGPGGIAAGELAVAAKYADGDYELRVAAAPGAADVRPHARRLQVARDVDFHVQADRSRYRAGEVVSVAVQRALADGKNNDTKGRTNTVPQAQVLLNGRRVPLLGATTSAPGGAVQNAPNNVAPGPGGFGGGFGGFNYQGGGYGGGGSQLNNANDYYLRFTLPADLDTSRVRIRIVLTEGDRRETYEHDLSIVPSRLALDVFPEGGELIAGVPNRVYYRVRSLRGEPVSPDGRVILLSSADVLLDAAPGEGAGSFTFTPKLGDTYSARITGPGGALAELPDPFARLGGARDGGLVLHTPQPVAGENEPLTVVLRQAGPPRRVLLVAQCRDHFVGQQWVEAKGAETAVTLGTLPGARGLVRVTAYDAEGGTLTPRAERLVYRAPAQRLELSVLHLGAVVSPTMGPRNSLLDLRARDEHGTPTDCWGLLAVVDERYRTREPSPLAHFFIAGDVRNVDDLDHAALLAADTPETRHALDQFLGTAGWRRFEPAAGKDRAVGAPSDAAFFGRENASPRTLQARHETRLAAALVPLQRAVQQEQARLAQNQQAAQGRLDLVRADLLEFEALPQEYLRLGLGAATVALFGLASLLLAVGAWRLVRHATATPLFAGSFACLGLCLVGTLIVASLSLTGESPRNTLAQLQPNHLPRAPGWLNFAPRLEVHEHLPTGPLALAAPAPLAQADAKRMDPARHELEGAINLNELALEKKAAPAGNARGIALATAAKKDAEQETMREARNRRYDQVLAQQEQLLRMKAAPLGPKAAATLPVPAAPPATRPLTKPAQTERELQAAQLARRGAFINEGGTESDTLVWDPSVPLASGSAQVPFDVPQAAGTYRVLFLGHTADGRLGFYEGRLEVQADPGR